MCWEVDYMFLAEQKKAREAQIRQEQRTGLIDKLLVEANQEAEKTKTEEAPRKEVAPAK